MADYKYEKIIIKIYIHIELLEPTFFRELKSKFICFNLFLWKESVHFSKKYRPFYMRR